MTQEEIDTTDTLVFNGPEVVTDTSLLKTVPENLPGGMGGEPPDGADMTMPGGELAKQFGETYGGSGVLPGVTADGPGGLGGMGVPSAEDILGEKTGETGKPGAGPMPDLSGVNGSMVGTAADDALNKRFGEGNWKWDSNGGVIQSKDGNSYFHSKGLVEHIVNGTQPPSGHFTLDGGAKNQYVLFTVEEIAEEAEKAIDADIKKTGKKLDKDTKESFKEADKLLNADKQKDGKKPDGGKDTKTDSKPADAKTGDDKKGPPASGDKAGAKMGDEEQKTKSGGSDPDPHDPDTGGEDDSWMTGYGNLIDQMTEEEIQKLFDRKILGPIDDDGSTPPIHGNKSGGIGMENPYDDHEETEKSLEGAKELAAKVLNGSDPLVRPGDGDTFVFGDTASKADVLDFIETYGDPIKMKDPEDVKQEPVTAEDVAGLENPLINPGDPLDDMMG